MRMLLHSPKDMVAGLIAFSAVSAIIGNAIFLQKGHHPSPMFGNSTVVALPEPMPAAGPLPKPRPSDAALTTPDNKLDTRMLDSKPVGTASDARLAAARSADPAALPMKAPASTSVPSPVARPPASIPHGKADPLGDLITNTRRVAAVQRALTEYGYGQLKPTGNVGSDTAAAIQRFERERRLPVTGQLSDRMVQELAAVTGRAID